MSKIIGDSLCPECAKNGHDSSENHLIHFEDGGKYCSHAEYHTSGKPYTVTADGYEDPYKEEDISVKNLKSNALKARGIDADISEKYGVKVEYNSNREEVKYYYPEKVAGKSVAYKVRELPKTFYNTGEKLKGQEVELWGQSTCSKGGKKLLITEAQDDCLAAHQMLSRKYPNFPPSVVANMGTSTKRVADNLDFVLSFDEVLLCFDPDEAGKKAVKDLAQLIGSKAKVVDTPLDINDMLKHGKAKEFINAFFSAQTYAPDGFVTVDDIFEEATAMPVWGKNWPWPTLTKLTYGRRLGEGIYFGAGVKIGKSEAVNQIAHHVTQTEKGKIALFKLEEKPSMTARKIAGKIMHKQFHVPDGDFTQEELIQGVNKVRGGVVMYDSYGSTGWDDLKTAIRHAVLVEGCQDIVIDPLTRLTTGMNSGDANTELERISDEISKMAKDLGFFYMIFAHLKAPQSGKAHEEGGSVHSNQFTGSRSMMRACYYMIGIQRDKTLEDEIERNTSKFVLLEDRAFGNSGYFDVFYNRGTGDYLEPSEGYL